MLKKNYVRDGNLRIIASVTTGFSDSIAVVQDKGNRIAGRQREISHHARRTRFPGLHRLL